jgi:hypothetical protein
MLAAFALEHRVPSLHMIVTCNWYRDIAVEHDRELSQAREIPVPARPAHIHITFALV